MTSTTTVEALRRLTSRAGRRIVDPPPRPDKLGPVVRPAPSDEIHSRAGNSIRSIVGRAWGGKLVSVVLVPSICHERLVVFSVNAKNATGWAIRDFIANRILDDEHSVRTRASIEAEIRWSHSEYPPFYSVGDPGHAERWELYLILRTSAHYRRQDAKYDTAPPRAVQGDTWQPISPEPAWKPLEL